SDQSARLARRLGEAPLGGEQERRAEQPATVALALGLRHARLPALGELTRLTALADGMAGEPLRAVLPELQGFARLLEVVVVGKVVTGVMSAGESERGHAPSLTSKPLTSAGFLVCGGVP